MFGLVEIVVTGLICSLSLAVVAIVIQSLKKVNREREGLLGSVRSVTTTRRMRGKIKMQRVAKVPTKHLRSQSFGLMESPQKKSFKHPQQQQHCRRKSSPSVASVSKGRTLAGSGGSGTLVTISPTLKCDKLFSLHQVQPASPADTVVESHPKTWTDKVGKRLTTVKPKHLSHRELNGRSMNELVKPWRKSDLGQDSVIGLEPWNNNNHALEKGMIVDMEK